jgi:hypothetical protein
MLNAILAGAIAALWLGSYALLVTADLAHWWRMRPYESGQSEHQRLEAVRAYAAWVRATPPPPPRPQRPTAVVARPEVPPLRGVIGPFPGRISEAEQTQD